MNYELESGKDVSYILSILPENLFDGLSGRLPRRKESGCPIRISASHPGVGNTPYLVLPSDSELA